MQLVRLTLDGMSLELTRQQVLASLASLYTKPESYFEPHCNHLFDLKKPFELLNEVEKSVAEQHQIRLNQIGIKTTITEMTAGQGLSHNPVDTHAVSISSSPPCSKAAIDPADDADEKRAAELIAQQESKARIKEAIKKCEEDYKTTFGLEGDDFDAEPIVVRTWLPKKSLVLASIAVVTTVAGSLFAFNQFNSNWAVGGEFEYVAVEQSEPLIAAAKRLSDSDKLDQKQAGTDVFSDWNQKLLKINALKQQKVEPEEVSGIIDYVVPVKAPGK